MAEIMLLTLSDIIPMHSEAKQTKTSEFRAEKGLHRTMQGDSGLCSKPPNSQKGFSKVLLKAR